MDTKSACHGIIDGNVKQPTVVFVKRLYGQLFFTLRLQLGLNLNVNEILY